MKRLILLYTIMHICMISGKAFAWGKTGHHIVAEIAQLHLKKNILDSVHKYLDTTSFENASTWMDDVRKDKSFDYMKPWHYINIEKDKTYVKNNDKNILNELELVISNLNQRHGRSKDEIATDLKILFHLMGDLHQPLHSGYAIDKGGNDVKIKYLGQEKNLHWFWDSDILDIMQINLDNVDIAYYKLSNERLKTIETINLTQWMNDSRAYLNQVYKFKKGKISKRYVKKAGKIIEQQLLYGGIRLATVLNSIFEH